MSRRQSSVMTSTQSLTPFSSTDWFPSGTPADASRPQACSASGVISLG